MARYVDGFVVPVPKKKLAAYRRMAEKAGRVWRDHGALEYIESVADDVKRGKWTSFPRSVKLKNNETIQRVVPLLPQFSLPPEPEPVPARNGNGRQAPKSKARAAATKASKVRPPAKNGKNGKTGKKNGKAR